MEEEPPPPEEPGRDHTGAVHKRPRTDSESSTSVESLESTRSLHSEDVEFVHENGRVYANHWYYMPCDQAEQDRLLIQHQVFVQALKGKLTTTRILPTTRRVLDLGTGPGYWAVAMAQQYPHVEVVGVDMAVWDLHTTEAVAGAAPVTWEIDDLDVWGVDSEMDDLTTRLEHYDPYRDHANRNPIESPHKPRARGESQPHTQPQTPAEPSFNPYVLEPEEQPGWHFSDTFDLIHLRNMKGCFAYWEEVYAEIYNNLSPGGWIEIADYDMTMPTIEQAVMPADFPFPTLRQMYLSMLQASFKAGRPVGTFYMHPSYLEEAGFKDIHTTFVNVPIGQWPEDEEQRKLGKMFLVSVMESLEPNILRLLTTWGDAERVWTVDEIREAVEKGKKEVLEWSRGPDGQWRGDGWCAHFKWIVGRKSKNA